MKTLLERLKPKYRSNLNRQKPLGTLTSNLLESNVSWLDLTIDDCCTICFVLSDSGFTNVSDIERLFEDSQNEI